MFGDDTQRLRRHGRHYKAQTQNKTHWTQRHHQWLEHTIEGLSGSLKVNLQLLLRQLQGLNEILAEYDRQVEALANTPRYTKPVQALTEHGPENPAHSHPKNAPVR